MAEPKKPVRCAIYTRKSTEDGLEQDYNSLDAQYDACTAYALSQRHEGWTLVPERYDDGGFSGGNMDRPGLNALLADIKAGKVDIILLYKIDRLTRSLSNFARIVDILDKAGASFVSITQSFNTTTSMGRLTLNMLLSFAQFEREVTGERIRDKIEASKKKGIWMGGPVPLGYDVIERKLIENTSEAQLVRHIMQRYLDLGSVKALVQELDSDGYRTKIQIRTSTANKGGCPFRRGTIYHLLSKRIYLGEIVHKGQGYAGEHQPIISVQLWDRVQEALADRSQGGTTRSPAKWPSLLIGMVIDGENRAMSPSHANKGQKRYRYYITRDDQLDGSPAWRVSAHDLERLVCSEVLRFLTDRQCVQNAFPDTHDDVQKLRHVLEQSRNAVTILESGLTGDKQRLLKTLASRIQLQEGAIQISVNPSALLESSESELNAPLDRPPVILTCETVRVRRGHEIRLIIPPTSDAPNSLDAQYDACAAYALSQRHEGWTVVKDRYDDGGFSGGNMNRPGLDQLLKDVKAGKVDIILLYKIDRLTRSLSDFARIVDVLDAAGASFVSITQSFNTTTSMGRLTLNMLLSFAQFEREVTGERIRDKIAASKRKGLWMGGPVPLGYEVVERKLVPNEQEAKTVRHIMQRYVALGSVKSLVAELDAQGYRTKVQVRTNTANKGGWAFRRGTLYHLLSNRIYLGEIVHKGASYPGEHDAIVPQVLWGGVQAALADRSQGGTSCHGAKYSSLLIGMVRDGEGRDMTPSHTNRGNRRYRYYNTRPEQVDGKPAWRVNAHDLEHLVSRTIAELFLDQPRLLDAIGGREIEAITVSEIFNEARIAGAKLTSDATGACKYMLEQLNPSITLQLGRIDIVMGMQSLATVLGISIEDGVSRAVELSCDAVRVRRGHEVRLVIAEASIAPPSNCDTKLVALLAEAQAAARLLSEHTGQSLSAIAKQQGRCRTRLGKLIELSCLAPDIVTAIVIGKQPAGLDSHVLMAAIIPMDWARQRKVLGFSLKR